MRTARPVTVLLLIWLIIGAIAAGQRHVRTYSARCWRPSLWDGAVIGVDVFVRELLAGVCGGPELLAHRSSSSLCFLERFGEWDGRLNHRG